MISPHVATNLMGGAKDPPAMPLKEYIDEAMELLKCQPTPAEICVKRVRALRFAEEDGRFEGLSQGLNSGLGF